MPFQYEEEIVPQMLELCAPILLTWDPQWKTQMENVLSKLFDLRGQTINIYDQPFST